MKDQKSVSPINKIDDRQKLHYHAWRRGMKEMDLILGHYADQYLNQMDQAKRLDFARLLARSDPELLGLLSGTMPPPKDDPDYVLLMDLRAFIEAGGAVAHGFNGF